MDRIELQVFLSIAAFFAGIAPTHACPSIKTRDTGPFWVIHPIDDHPELASELVHAKMIGQLQSVDVE